MATEILEMEARLKNYISDNLKDIQKDLKKTDEKVKEASKGFEKFSKELKGNLTRSFLSAQAAMVALGIAWVGLNRIASESIDLYKEQVNAEQKLQSALKATKNQVGISYKEMIKYSKEMQKMTIFGDEAVIKTQALMVTFTKIGKDVFPQAIKSAADMSAMFGQDLQQSAIQLGTALNDPIAGVGRLRRIGISFTETQKDQIEKFVEQNDLMSAQKVILQELQDEFGGVAEELAKTDVGKLEQMNNDLNDQKELIGKHIIPLYIGWLKAVNNVFKGITKVANIFTDQEAKDMRKNHAEKMKLLNAQLHKKIEIDVLTDQINKAEKEGVDYVEVSKALGYIQSIKVAKEMLVDLQNEHRKLMGLPPLPIAGVSQEPAQTEKQKEEAEKKAKEAKKLAEKIAKEKLQLEKDVYRAGEKALKEYREKQFDDAQAEWEFRQNRQDQILDSEILLQETKIQIMQEGIDKELAILDYYYSTTEEKYKDNEEAIKNIKMAAAIERKELIEKQTKAEIESVVSYYQSAGDSLISIAKHVLNASIKNARARRAILTTMAIADAAAASVKGVRVVWDSAKTYYEGIAGTIAVLAQVASATIPQIAKIKGSGFQRGGIVPGNDVSGDNVSINANSREMVLTTQQQAELFNIAKGNSTTTTNNNASLQLSFNVPGGITRETNAIISDMGEKLNRTLLEGFRNNQMGDFVQVLKQELVV